MECPRPRRDRKGAADCRRPVPQARPPRSHDGSSVRALVAGAAAPAVGSRDVLGPRIALHHAIRRLDVLQLQSGIAEAFDDQIVPGEFAHAVHVARHAAADDQAVGRPRHRHIEQAAVFVLGLAQHRGAGRGDRGRIVGLPAGPDHDAGRVRLRIALRQMDQLQPLGIRRRRGGVDQEHDGRLQPLGAVHRHDADFVARDFHVALHFGVGGAQPRHKALQRGRRLALIAQGEFEKFVERVVGFMAEPLQDPLAAAVAAEQPGIERERRFGEKAALAGFKALAARRRTCRPPRRGD